MWKALRGMRLAFDECPEERRMGYLVITKGFVTHSLPFDVEYSFGLNYTTMYKRQ